MVNYNFEYQYFEYKHNPREYKVPIKTRINNIHYKQQQTKLLRELFPGKLNKQIKVN